MTSKDNISKYENTILYLCSALGGTLFGKKKLAKLLYYTDFDRYEYKESEKSVTGDTYEAWKMGPVPKSYSHIIDSLVKKSEMGINETEQANGYLPTIVYTALKNPNLSVFDEDDLAILNHVVKKYGQLTGAQLENLTHSEAPYVGTERNGEIVYELAFYRGTDFSDVVAVSS